MNSIELFSGGGGLALGLVKSCFHHKAIVELNKMLVKQLDSIVHLISENVCMNAVS